MIKLKRLTNEQYTVADTFFRSKDAQQITKDYFNYVYTSCLDYLDSGDVNILNRMITASKLVNRVRMTQTLIGMVACHSQVAGKYKGKAKTARLKRLRAAPTSELKSRQENVINADTEKRERVSNTFDVDQTETRIVNALASLMAHNADVDLDKLVGMAQAKKDKVKVKSIVPAQPEPVPAH